VGESTGGGEGRGRATKTGNFSHRGGERGDVKGCIQHRTTAKGEGEPSNEKKTIQDL